MDIANENIFRNDTPARVGSVSKIRLRSGLIIGTAIVAFLIFDSVSKLLRVDAAIKGSEQLGIGANIVPVIGFILLACTAIFIIPRTRVLGAILLTGYFGGAIFAHVRVGNGAFPIVFSAAFAILVWTTLVLREPNLLKLILLRQWPDQRRSN